MNLKNVKTRSDFENILNKVDSLKDNSKKLSYLNEIVIELESIIKSEGKIKLLSSAEVNYYKEGLREAKLRLRKLQEFINDLEKTGKEISDKKISVEEARLPKDYITWVGNYDCLTALIRTLIEYGYFVKSGSTVNNIIKEHFYIENYSKPVNHIPTKIKWGKSQPLIGYFIEKLFNLELIDSKLYENRWIITAKHFCKESGGSYTNKNLSKSISQGGNKPKGHEMLNDHIEDVINEFK